MGSLTPKEYPAVVTFMSLLKKDIGNSAILKQIVEIHKYFRNVLLAVGLLKEKGCTTKLSNETQNLQVRCQETYKKSIYFEIWVKGGVVVEC